jgi:hypothetical protein
VFLWAIVFPAKAHANLEFSSPIDAVFQRAFATYLMRAIASYEIRLAWGIYRFENDLAPFQSNYRKKEKTIDTCFDNEDE